MPGLEWVDEAAMFREDHLAQGESANLYIALEEDLIGVRARDDLIESEKELERGTQNDDLTGSRRTSDHEEHPQFLKAIQQASMDAIIHGGDILDQFGAAGLLQEGETRRRTAEIKASVSPAVASNHSEFLLTNDGCATHKLQLSIQLAFVNISVPIVKAKRIASLYRSSTAFKRAVTQVAETLGLPVGAMAMQNNTRWGSGFAMLRTVCRAREILGPAILGPAISAYKSREAGIKVKPLSEGEHKTADAVRETLKALETISAVLGAETTPTAPLPLTVVETVRNVFIVKESGAPASKRFEQTIVRDVERRNQEWLTANRNVVVLRSSASRLHPAFCSVKLLRGLDEEALWVSILSVVQLALERDSECRKLYPPPESTSPQGQGFNQEPLDGTEWRCRCAQPEGGLFQGSCPRRSRSDRRASNSLCTGNVRRRKDEV